MDVILDRHLRPTKQRLTMEKLMMTTTTMKMMTWMLLLTMRFMEETTLMIGVVAWTTTVALFLPPYSRFLKKLNLGIRGA
jgi:hypothetical protein